MVPHYPTIRAASLQLNRSDADHPGQRIDKLPLVPDCDIPDDLDIDPHLQNLRWITLED